MLEKYMIVILSYMSKIEYWYQNWIKLGALLGLKDAVTVVITITSWDIVERNLCC